LFLTTYDFCLLCHSSDLVFIVSAIENGGSGVGGARSPSLNHEEHNPGIVMGTTNLNTMAFASPV
jgi:hypothetical protein